jgi:hypothetical protein
MTWILLTAPLMLLAIAIAVLPVLLFSIRESRLGGTPPSSLSSPKTVRPPAYAYDTPDELAA